jgi:CheY-like chemotaxis protein
MLRENSAIASSLLALYNNRSTGKFIVTSVETTLRSWKLYFYAGCLVYATGGNDPTFCWQRTLKQHGITTLERSPQSLKTEDGWELALLNRGLQNHQINAEQAKAIIQDLVQEAIISLLKTSNVTTEWQAEVCIDPRLAFLSVEKVLEEATCLMSISRAKGLVACIDDSPAVGRMLTQILNLSGYEALTITNPLKGITTLLDRKPDLIFLDLMMPNTNGYEICSILRKTSIFKDTPIIILTQSDCTIDRVRAKLVGSSGFLTKPIEPNKIVKVVDKYLDQDKVTPSPIKESNSPFSGLLQVAIT